MYPTDRPWQLPPLISMPLTVRRHNYNLAHKSEYIKPSWSYGNATSGTDGFLQGAWSTRPRRPLPKLHRCPASLAIFTSSHGLLLALSCGSCRGTLKKGCFFPSALLPVGRCSSGTEEPPPRPERGPRAGTLKRYFLTITEGLRQSTAQPRKLNSTVLPQRHQKAGGAGQRGRGNPLKTSPHAPAAILARPVPPRRPALRLLLGEARRGGARLRSIKGSAGEGRAFLSARRCGVSVARGRRGDGACGWVVCRAAVMSLNAC